MIEWSTEAPNTIFVVAVSPPPPPPLPAGRSTETTSAPLLFFSVRRTELSSSLRSAVAPKMVFASISFSLAVTAEFCTGLVLEASRLSSTSVSLKIIFTFPVLSGFCLSPLTVTLFTVPAPPKSSQLATCPQLERLVPANCFVSHLPCETS